MQYTVGIYAGLVISILVLFLGRFTNRLFPLLSRIFIPPVVTGGILFSLALWALYAMFDIELTFDMDLRNVLMLAFFSTIGLSASFGSVIRGGKLLVILVILSLVFLVLQDANGVLFAKLFGVHPGYGLMGGSVTFAGGYGTAIAWGKEGVKAGLDQAELLGVVFATLGMISGGLMGGPVANYVIRRHRLHGSDETNIDSDARELDGARREYEHDDNYTTDMIMRILLALGLCIVLGGYLNQWLTSLGLTLPGFLTSMVIGIIIANLNDAFKIHLNSGFIDKFGTVTLNLFLAMSLMNMQLWNLNAGVGFKVLLVLAAQMVLMALYTIYVVFPLLGKNYDSAVICSGFVGFGLGATPVAIANMNSITSRYGPSPAAFLVVPLIGAFFIDIMNAIVIKTYIAFF